jgi:hypothetical protein
MVATLARQVIALNEQISEVDTAPAENAIRARGAPCE